MLNFFSIFKNKKLFAFICLFVFLFNVNIKIAHATCTASCSYTDCHFCECSATGKCERYIFNTIGVFQDQCHEDDQCVTGSMVAKEGPDSAGSASFGWDFWQAIPVALARLLLWICWAVAGLSAGLFQTVFSYTRSITITTNNNFLPGWTLVRDLGNMLIVLGFVVVGIATALRIREYEAKKLLWPLILAALLINFSGLFCGLIIDASNITLNGLVQTSETQTQVSGVAGTTIVTALEVYGRKAFTQNFVQNNPWKFITLSLTYDVLYITIAITFFYIAIILIIRYAVLAFLFILSPIAFIAWVFPASKKLWTEWWNNFLKWAFVGVIAGFFLTIAQSLIPTDPDPSKNTMGLIMVLIFLITGFKMTAKSTGLAAMAGTAVMGLATGGAGLAMGAVAAGAKGGAKMADRLSGGTLSGAAQKVSGGAGRMMERIGLREKGATALGKQGQIKEPQNRMSALISEGRIGEVQRIAKGQGEGGNSVKRAGATAALLESKNFDMSDTRQVNGLKNFQQQGGDLSKYTEKNPLLAKHDINKMKKYMAPTNQGGLGLSEDAAGNKLEQEAFEKLSGPAMIDMPTVAVKNENFAKVLMKNPARVGKAAERMSDEKINTIKDEHMVKTDASGSTLPLSQQGNGVKTMYAEMDKYPLGSPERAEARRRIVSAQKELHNNPYFA